MRPTFPPSIFSYSWFVGRTFAELFPELVEAWEELCKVRPDWFVITVVHSYFIVYHARRKLFSAVFVVAV